MRVRPRSGTVAVRCPVGPVRSARLSAVSRACSAPDSRRSEPVGMLSSSGWLLIAWRPTTIANSSEEVVEYGWALM